MRKVSRSALVPYSASEMYALVENVAAYPEFLPWCTGATEHSRDADVVEVSLELRRGGITKTFRTRNSLQPGVAMSITLVGGPFRQLSGGWRFEQLGEEGSKVSLNLEFEFRNRVTDAVFGRYFEDICNSLIDAFTSRAHKIYG
ncbi:MAG: type II toxin-antitoxin system RatA family toxin [Proteobacteria bacterium]|nr:type II toxin-antitoxin system RatA family toxin [Pseudomonadota bacterium]